MKTPSITSAQFVKGIRGTDPILQDGRFQAAFIGRSNVGKSSLIASLIGSTGQNTEQNTGKKLVKTGKTPGKTKEINFFFINNDLYFVDLPGYGFALMGAAEREQLRKMILWYLFETVIPARLVVLIVDAFVGLTDFDKQMLATLQEHGVRFIVVANKIDKLKRNDISKQIALLTEQSGGEVVAYSSKERVGRAELLDAIFSARRG